MRRTDREVTDPAAIDAIIRACPCCRLGLRDGEGVYLVPLNFGFANVDGQRTIMPGMARMIAKSSMH